MGWWKQVIHRMGRQRERGFALSHGYFWLPCSLCGGYYGGHEKSASLSTGWAEGPFEPNENGKCPRIVYGGTSVCLNCKDEADRLNLENDRLENWGQFRIEHGGEKGPGTHIDSWRTPEPGYVVHPNPETYVQRSCKPVRVTVSDELMERLG